MPCWRSSLNAASKSALDVVSMPPSPVVITLRGWNEKQAMSPTGTTDRLAIPVHADLASGGAGGVFDQRDSVTAATRRAPRGRMASPSDGRREWRACAGVTASATQLRIEIVGARLDIDEDRDRSAIADAVGRRDEGMARHDHLVAAADADGQESEMQRRRAARHGAGMGRPDTGGELAFEGGDLRALRHPAREYDPACRLGLRFIEDRLGDRDHDAAACSSAGAGERSCSVRHQSTSARKPSSSGIVGPEAE